MENQEIMDQFLENRQNYMMDNNMQQQHINVATAGCENVGGVAENVVGGGVGGVVGVGGEILGVKYDEQHQHEEHDVGDDDESKYVKEVQQSEKLQSLKSFGLAEDEDVDGGYENNETMMMMAEKDVAKGSPLEFGNGGGGGMDDGAFLFGGNHLLQQHKQDYHKDMFNVGNGHDDTNGHQQNLPANVEFEIQSSQFEQKNLFDNELEDGYKAVGDFSSSFNMTESSEQYVPQVDVKIETKPEQPQEAQELGDEEEPSSLATNTTNGTSSLSENVAAPQEASNPAPANAFDDFMATLENKENADPLTPQRPDVLDIDQAHAGLNPDAKEFIPSFGSNPSSPTSPFAAEMPSSDLGEPMETQMYFGQQPSAVPRHLLGDDDFVAQSPRKGRGDNMDAVPLPKELSEFEEEADKRPHELEAEDSDLLQSRDGVMTPDQQVVQQLPLDDIVQEIPNSSSTQDITDFQPSSFMDHGPETCVDLDNDLDLQPQASLSNLQQDEDIMKRSIYVASDEAAIEDVLNSVQPIPTEIDSVNNSFIEESATESAAVNLAIEKELLQVEEKEHVSHSPSTEEMQMNLQNTLNSSNKDIPQIPIDMDNDQQIHEPMEQHDPEHQPELEHKSLDHADLQADIENVLTSEVSFLDNSFEAQHDPQQLQQDIEDTFEAIASHAVSSAPGLEALNFDDLSSNQQQAFNDDILTPSSTADEKHLLEETKEQFSISGLEQQMSEMNFNNDDGNFAQPEEVAAPPAATTAIDDVSEHLISSPDDAAIVANIEKMLVDESFGQHIEQEELKRSQNELHEEHQEPIREPVHEFIESPIDNQQLESEMVAVEEPIIEVKQSAPLFNTEETEHHVNESHNLNEDFGIEISMVPETAPAEYLEQPSSILDVEPEIVKEQEKPVEPEMAMEVVEEVKAEEPKPEEFKFEETKLEEPQLEELKMEETKLEEPKLEELKLEELKLEDSKLEEVKADNDIAIPVAAAAATAVAAVTAAAVAAVKTPSSPSKKSDSAKKPLAKPLASTTAKPKVGSTTAAKKPLEAVKKPATSLAAKPRVAPAKPATTTATASAEKKPLAKPSTTSTSTRKPLSAGTTTAAKPAVKTTTTTTRTVTASARPTTSTTSTRPTTAPRTITSATTRKPLTTTSSTTNGPAAKPRPATAPAKPTSLGLPATNGAAKTKVTSPRSTLTSQLRKAPTTTSSSGAKSPVKTSTATNGVANKTATSSTLASRTKTTTSSSSTTHGTGAAPASKTFTARPAPKFTTSSSSTTTTTTTRRLTVGGTTAATTTTTTTTKSSGAPLRKSSPSKPLGGRTPTRTSATTAGSLKSKTPLAKKESPPQQKPAPIRKPVDKTITNGEAINAISKELNGGEGIGDNAEKLTQQNGGSDLQQNGDSNIPIQNFEQPLIEQRDEQIPMDLINA